MDDQVVTPKPVLAPPVGTAVGDALEECIGEVGRRLAVKWRAPGELWAHIGDGGLKSSDITTWQVRDLAAERVGSGVGAAWLERRCAAEWCRCCAEVFDVLRAEWAPDLAYRQVFALTDVGVKSARDL